MLKTNPLPLEAPQKLSVEPQRRFLGTYGWKKLIKRQETFQKKIEK